MSEAENGLSTRGREYLVNPDWMDPLMDCIKMSLEPVDDPYVVGKAECHAMACAMQGFA